MASIPIQPIISNAAEEYVLLGDVNNDSSVSIADTACIIQFLSGTFTPSAHSFTAMDYNCDGIIDMTDANAIQFKLAYDLSDITIYRELYTVPDNSSITYRKHNYSSTNNFSYSTYTLSVPSTLTSSFASVSALDLNSELSASKLVDELEATQTETTNTPDTENDACVELRSGNGGYFGSGFVVGPHVIATAAHCLYNSEGFVNNFSVKLHKYVNGSTTPQTYTATPINLHIPSNFISGTSYNYNYDYGLIYVGDFVDDDNNVLNVSNYSVSLGVMTDNFINAELGLITSVGYIGNANRVQSTGVIKSNVSIEQFPYRFKIYTEAIGGKSGGMNYYDSSYVTSQFSILTRSTLGITSSKIGNTYTLCTRITPTLLRFYKANSNL